MATAKVTQQHDAESVRALLGLPEIRQFVSNLDHLHETGRPGFGPAVLVGAALVKAVYCLPTWSRTARLIAEHDALRDAIGGAPSQWACYRFAVKLREHGDALANCIDAVLAKLPRHGSMRHRKFLVFFSRLDFLRLMAQFGKLALEF